MRFLVGTLAWVAMLVGVSAQPIEVTDEEALVLRTKTYVGKRVTVKGWMTAADELSASVSFDAGRLKAKTMSLRWPAKEGEFYERSRLTCSSWNRVPACKMEVSGVVTASANMADYYYLDEIEVKWAK